MIKTSMNTASTFTVQYIFKNFSNSFDKHNKLSMQARLKCGKYSMVQTLYMYT